MERLNLDVATSDDPWDWLRDAARRLDIALEVVGPDLESLVPPDSEGAANTLHRLLTTDDTFRSAIESSLQSGASESAVAPGFLAICCTLLPNRVLIVGRHIAEAEQSDHRRDLDAISRWLVPGVQTALTQSSGAINAEAYRMASLRRILEEAAARGTARTVVGAFIEVLGVWDEVQVFGYAATLAGGFTRYASPRGVATPAPVELARGDVPASGRIEPLAADAIDRLRLRGGGESDVMIGRIKTTDGLEWAHLFLGPVGSIGQVRLALYSDILREVLDKTLRVTFERSVEAIDRRPPLHPDQPIDLTAQALAAHLMGAIEARQAALAMVLTTGRQLFAVGSLDLLTPHATQSVGGRLTVTSRTADSLLTFAAARDASPFTAFEQHAAQVGVDAVHRWFERAVRETVYERRHQTRRVDALFDELAAGAIRAGEPVSLAVLSFGADVLSPGLLQAAVATIRDHIRSSDFAGILSATEIGVLLSDVPDAQAGALSARLHDLLTSSDESTAAMRPSVGVATWSPGRDGAGSIVAAARAALRPAARFAPAAAE